MQDPHDLDPEARARPRPNAPDHLWQGSGADANDEDDAKRKAALAGKAKEEPVVPADW
jgi:hypothetical protein